MNVDLRDIHKTFGRVHANAGIDLAIPAGTIQGVLGENGAGKSTLMKILSGFIQADRGQILLDGEPVVIHSPADAIRHGIGMLHQDPLDFLPMRVLDNFLIGAPGGLFPDRKRAERDLRALTGRFDFSLDPNAYIDTLTVGERQQLEILRLLHLGARVLILDEPTTGISASQKEKLFATLKTLAADGMTVIFVSHKLEDVEQLCSRVAVLQAGRLVGQTAPPYSTARLVEMMFGKPVTLGARQPAAPGGAPALEVQGLEIESGRLHLRGIDLKVRAGEVIGLAGMEGSGQGAFLRACAGLLRPVAGRVWIGQRNLTGRSYHTYKKYGVNFLPAARLEEGLVPGLTLSEHFVLSEGGRGLFIDRAHGKQLAEERIAGFNIRGRPESPVESLSGGNQQRALLALLQSPLSLILLEHPTRGLDIESVIYIWSRLKERCRQGAAIVFISSDLDEILQYSDRVLVFFSGRVSPPLEAGATGVAQLGQLIGGKGWTERQPGEEAVHA